MNSTREEIDEKLVITTFKILPKFGKKSYHDHRHSIRSAHCSAFQRSLQNVCGMNDSERKLCRMNSTLDENDEKLVSTTFKILPKFGKKSYHHHRHSIRSAKSSAIQWSLQNVCRMNDSERKSSRINPTLEKNDEKSVFGSFKIPPKFGKKLYGKTGKLTRCAISPAF
jgi:hypothetical protein